MVRLLVFDHAVRPCMLAMRLPMYARMTALAPRPVDARPIPKRRTAIKLSSGMC